MEEERREEKRSRSKYGRRKERGPEGQEIEWKHAVALGGGVNSEQNLQKVPATWNVKGAQDSMRVTLVEMTNSAEMEPEQSTSSRQTGTTVEGQGYQPTCKTFDLGLFLSKRNAGTKMEKRLKESHPVTGLTWDPSHG